MKYSSDGGLLAVLVSKNDLPYGMMTPSGILRVCSDSTRHSIYAENGSVRIESSGTGFYTPSGAMNGVLVGSTFYPQSFSPRDVLFDFESLSFSGLTYSRTGPGTAMTKEGLFTQFSADVPRVTNKGLMLESSSSNLLSRYSPTASQFIVSAAVADVSAPSDPPITGLNWIELDNNSATAYAYQLFAAQLSTLYTIQCLVETQDESPPVCGATALTGDFCLFIGGNNANLNITSQRLSGRNWLVTAQRNVTTNNGTNGVVRFPAQTKRVLKFSGYQLELTRVTSPLLNTGTPLTRGQDQASLTVPYGCTKYQAVYGDSRTLVSGSGLTPLSNFDLFSGRPWVGMGNELKQIRFTP